MPDLNSIQQVFFKKQTPTNTAVQTLTYNNKPFYIRTRLAMNSLIFFPESIATYTIGDSSFKLELVDTTIKSSALSIRPTKYSKIDTNLVVVGVSGRVYNFYIWSTKYDSRYIPHLTTYIKLKKQDNNELLELRLENAHLKAKLKEKSRSIFDVNLGELDFSYAIKGDKNKHLASVFRSKTHTFIALNSDLIPTIKDIEDVELSFVKKRHTLAINALPKRLFLSFGSSQILVQKTKPYKEKNIKEKLDVSKLEFNYKMQVRFYGFWDNLKRSFDKNHFDVKRFTPTMIFNNNNFTYFLFDLSRADKILPQVYKISDEKDTIVNTSILDGIVKVDVLSPKFILRAGNKHLCVDKYE